MNARPPADTDSPGPCSSFSSPGATRRDILKALAAATAGLAVFGPGGVLVLGQEAVITDNALGLVLADPTRCTGCLRCEIACSEYNDGQASLALSRIKVARNLFYGPTGPAGPQPGTGAFGNGLFIQDACRQCPHPVPCATACPHGAITTQNKTLARVVDEAKCVGCRLCQRACPFGMMVFDEARSKASKCHLCQGAPKCVAGCPAGALRFVPWRDLTREIPPRTFIISVRDPKAAASCRDCHQ